MDIHNAPVAFKSSIRSAILPTSFQKILSLLPLPMPDLAIEDTGKLSVLMGGSGMDLILTLQ